jgi:outer membrane protein assembly factor BamB
MKTLSAIFKLLPIALMIAGGLSLLSLLLIEGRGAHVSLRVPIAENSAKHSEDAISFVGELTTSDGQPSTLPGAWPGFRGPNMNAIVTVDLSGPLNRQWEVQQPKVLWDIQLGEGYAGAAVANGRVYVLDYDQSKQGDTIRCLSLDDGREIWRYFYKVKIKRNHGMSRTIPVVAGDCVITIGPKCHVVCLDAVTGALRWKRDLVREDGAEVPPWYAGQCPLVDGNRLILGVGGTEALVMALDYRTGEVIWRTPNPQGWKMTHSSLTPMTLGDEKSYVYCAGGGVAGVSSTDGSLLWQYPDWHINIANVPAPVVIDSQRVFLSGGYNAGSMMLAIKHVNKEYRPEVLFRLDAKVFGSDQQTPIYFNGYLYGVRPGGQLVCLDPDGQILWTSSSAHKFGTGPYSIINGMLYVMNDEGYLTMAKATPEAYTPLTAAQVLQGHESWGPMAFVSGRLIVRDLTHMVCLDIMERTNE